MIESVYIETTIFSFYHDRRLSPAVIAMHEWTRQWWDTRRHHYDVVTSTAVLAELDTGSLEHRADALAMASVKKFDYLLTWNCRHLANANKFAHIRRVNALLGLHSPALITPLELMGEEDGP